MKGNMCQCENCGFSFFVGKDFLERGNIMIPCAACQEMHYIMLNEETQTVEISLTYKHVPNEKFAVFSCIGCGRSMSISRDTDVYVCPACSMENAFGINLEDNTIVQIDDRNRNNSNIRKKSLVCTTCGRTLGVKNNSSGICTCPGCGTRNLFGIDIETDTIVQISDMNRNNPKIQKKVLVCEECGLPYAVPENLNYFCPCPACSKQNTFLVNPENGFLLQIDSNLFRQNPPKNVLACECCGEISNVRENVEYFSCSSCGTVYQNRFNPETNQTEKVICSNDMYQTGRGK